MKVHASVPRLALLAFLAVLCACTREALLPEAGIPREWARARRSALSDLSYDLSFRIPASSDEAVSGEETLTFTLKSREDVVLDYLFPGDSLVLPGPVTVNGVPVAPLFTRDHIVLPRSALRGGANTVHLSFLSADGVLNRNADYLYTLFVPARAHTVFPCFDQPDLKAAFRLRLQVPPGWRALSNTAVAGTESLPDGGTRFTFGRTAPLSTYLFSFVAGKWESRHSVHRGRLLRAWFRETDPAKLAQLDAVFAEVAEALDWMEAYTGMPMPFPKYEFVIVPGFQFGGMEHPGAILFNENTIFLGPSPTPDEREKRLQLIAHETAHLWFGDLVTMQWFDDVWTKEVFANYFAALISGPLFPGADHDLVWMKDYMLPALAQDRTGGTTPIKQELGNLSDAGLVYNNIVYDKAPLMMRTLADRMGPDAFREGLRDYLSAFAWGNADWNDLIDVLDAHTDADLQAFSSVWVESAGCPVLSLEKTDRGYRVDQFDPLDRDLHWPQTLRLRAPETGEEFELTLGGAVSPEVVLPPGVSRILPNCDGHTYARFELDPVLLRSYMDAWPPTGDAKAREALAIIVDDHYLSGRIPAPDYVRFLTDALSAEKDPVIASTLVSFLPEPLAALAGEDRRQAEVGLFLLTRAHSLPSSRLQVLRLLIGQAVSPAVVSVLFKTWKLEDDPNLSVSDYMRLSWEMALRFPEDAAAILARQRSRLDGTDPHRPFHADRLRQFDFVSRALSPVPEDRKSLFEELLTPAGRTVEPWASAALAYLNHPLRSEEAVGLIRPALEALEEVQRTGDIFFPAAWCSALLGGHRSDEALLQVQAYLDAHPDLRPLLRGKVLVAAAPLERASGGKLH